ncbi:MAG: hypothetical protein ABI224_17935 [Acetobacteraceae bacterium]
MTQNHDARMRRDTVSLRTIAVDGACYAVLTLPVLGIAAWLWHESMQNSNCTDRRSILAIAHWFDPVFFQYNLLLAALAILIVPSVPLLYVHAMTWRKKVRLLREIPTDQLPEVRRLEVDYRLLVRGSYRFYLGSTVLASIVVALGISILLLFKPVREAAQCGVDFSKGANMLMMGPFIESYGSGAPQAFDLFYKHLMSGLVGFQFGFLGAYIYFLISLTRAYFMLDLTPETMIDGAIRIAVASTVSLVLSFVAERMNFLDVMPVLSFFFGFFPKRALAFLEQFALSIARTMPTASYKATPLSALHGMTYNHELRLEREGFEDAENLSHADAVDLAVRTGFSYGQLRQWISEAWLAAHLGDDYSVFVARTGIMSRKELEDFIAYNEANGTVTALIPTDDADPSLPRLRNKLRIIQVMLQAAREPICALPKP